MTSDKLPFIFISHKTEDRNKARELKRILLDNSEHKPEIFVAGDSIRGGRNWREEIRKALTKTNLFILLYTDPDIEWEWCAYEVGLFTPLENDVTIICLHSRQQAPGFLDDKQAIYIDSADIQPEGDNENSEPDPTVVNKNTSLRDNFLKPLFTGHLGIGGWQPLRDNNNPKELAPIVYEIVRIFEVKDIQYMHPRISLCFTQDTLMSIKEDQSALPNKLEIRSKNNEGLAFLNMQGSRTTWAKMKRPSYSEWEQETASQIWKIIDGQTVPVNPRPLQARGKSYTTIVDRVEFSQGRLREVEMYAISTEGCELSPIPDGTKSKSESTEYDLISDLKKWHTYEPLSLLRIVWTGNKPPYNKDDMEGLPVVIWANVDYRDLFGFTEPEYPPDPNGNSAWTADVLMKQLKQCDLVDLRCLDQFEKDQERTNRRIIFDDGRASAKVPIRLSVNHPIRDFQGKDYLPVVVGKRRFGEYYKRHTTILMVALVEDFVPPKY